MPSASRRSWVNHYIAHSERFFVASCQVLPPGERMDRASRTLCALAALTLSGCLIPGGGGEENLRAKYPAPLFEDYVSYIKFRTMDEVPYERAIPTIPPSLQLSAPLVLASPFRMELELASLDATKLCFAFDSKGDRSTLAAEDIAKKELARLQDFSVSIRALSSLAPERGRPLWPTPEGATHLDSFTVVSDEVKDFDNRARGTVERRREVTIHICAPAPEITSATKFIAITAHFPTAAKPDYKSFHVANNDGDRRNIERDNQEERFQGDGLILIAITDGAPDLSM